MAENEENAAGPGNLNLGAMLQGIECFCQSCQPPFQLLEKDREIFSDLVVSSGTSVEIDGLEGKLNRPSLGLFRADELRTSSVEDLAEDLSKLPINEACRKIERLAEVVRDAGPRAGFYGVTAVDRILRAEPMTNRRHR